VNVIACGGRHYPHAGRVFRIMDMVHAEVGIDLLVNGGAPGADLLARRWAVERRVKTKFLYADWSRFGFAAGPIRNREMLAFDIGLVVAFPGGKGTADMARQAGDAGILVMHVPDAGFPSTHVPSI
jgi:hypothetical protein